MLIYSKTWEGKDFVRYKGREHEVDDVGGRAGKYAKVIVIEPPFHCDLEDEYRTWYNKLFGKALDNALETFRRLNEVQREEMYHHALVHGMCSDTFTHIEALRKPTESHEDNPTDRTD